MASLMKDQHTVCAFDWRGHGDHFREDETMMSTETLIADALEVLEYLLQKYPSRSLIVIGHSMGGALATKVVSHIQNNMPDSDLKKAVLGTIIIDVVEGSAMEALPFME